MSRCVFCVFELFLLASVCVEICFVRVAAWDSGQQFDQKAEPVPESAGFVVRPDQIGQKFSNLGQIFRFRDCLDSNFG